MKVRRHLGNGIYDYAETIPDRPPTPDWDSAKAQLGELALQARLTDPAEVRRQFSDLALAARDPEFHACLALAGSPLDLDAVDHEPEIERVEPPDPWPDEIGGDPTAALAAAAAWAASTRKEVGPMEGDDGFDEKLDRLLAPRASRPGSLLVDVKNRRVLTASGREVPGAFAVVDAAFSRRNRRLPTARQLIATGAPRSPSPPASPAPASELALVASALARLAERVARQPAPVVNVAAPVVHVPAPQVDVHVAAPAAPKPRAVRVDYDDEGRKRYVSEEL